MRKQRKKRRGRDVRRKEDVNWGMVNDAECYRGFT